jgi:hypothetical protein
VLSHQLEAWVHDLVDRVRSNSPVEDARVELKARWPDDAARAARRLAAHANAARGESILWLIGVDEKACAVPGAERTELSAWWPQVQARFDVVYPELQAQAVPIEQGIAVVALVFETRQAPYLVKNPAHGSARDPVTWEVPWRDNTRTRSARRSELLRILSPIQLLPDIEVMDASLVVSVDADFDGAYLEWRLQAAAYFVPRSDRPIVIPFHKCQARAIIDDLGTKLVFTEVRLGPEWEGRPQPEAKPIASEVALRSPSRLVVAAYCRTEDYFGREPPSLGSAEVTARLGAIGSDHDLTITWPVLEPCESEDEEDIQSWCWKQPVVDWDRKA